MVLDKESRSTWMGQQIYRYRSVPQKKVMQVWNNMRVNYAFRCTSLKHFRLLSRALAL